MFIELAEALRCPRAHAGRHYCVLAPTSMRGRDVLTGDIACPVCGATYPILSGVADLRRPEDTGAGPDMPHLPLPSPDDVVALLGVHGPGGYVVLIGSAGRLAASLARSLEGVHLVLVNPPDGVKPAQDHSCIRGGRGVPLATAFARGVVVGAEHAMEPWLAEAARLLLRGLRLIALLEGIDAAGISVLASGQGMTLGIRE